MKNRNKFRAFQIYLHLKSKKGIFISESPFLFIKSLSFSVCLSTTFYFKMDCNTYCCCYRKGGYCECHKFKKYHFLFPFSL